MIYTVHTTQPLTGLDPAQQVRMGLDLVAIPERASPLALFAPPLWLAWHRLWFAVICYGLTIITLATLLATPYWMAAAAVMGLPGLYLWLEGHQLRRARLERQGYVMSAVVEAPNEEAAVARALAVSSATERGSVPHGQQAVSLADAAAAGAL